MQDRIMLIGLGPHARTYYVKIINLLKKSHAVELAVVVDLQCQEESIREYLTENQISIQHLELIGDENRNSEFVTENVALRLNQLKEQYSINRVIISTEPKAHKAYALWAAQNNLSTLMDKPLTAVDMKTSNPEDAFLLTRDFNQIKEGFDYSDADLYVMALRRVHPAITFAREYLAKFIEQYQVPITNVCITHYEGMWNMPNEFFERENHPYKFGYGLMLHSGYHFVDLFLLFVRLNNILLDKSATDMDYAFAFSTVSDINRIIDNQNYRDLMNKEFDELKSEELIQKAEEFGEIDMHILCNVNHHNKLVTSGMIDLLQTSYSTRHRHQLPKDTYKDNGRTYHEFIDIQVGHLLNIKLMCNTNGKTKDMESASKADQRYKVLIYRNSDLVGGKNYEEHIFDREMTFNLGGDEFNLDIGTAARSRCVYNWLYEDSKASLLDTHKYTIDWLTGIYKNMFEARNEHRRIANGNLNLEGFSSLPHV